MHGNNATMRHADNGIIIEHDEKTKKMGRHSDYADPMYEHKTEVFNNFQDAMKRFMEFGGKKGNPEKDKY